MKKPFILWFHEISSEDVHLVGGKNASLGEMISKTKVPVPDGFAITSYAYRYFIKYSELEDYIRERLEGLNTRDIKKLHRVGESIRTAIRNAKMPADLEREILKAYDRMCRKFKTKNLFVAVRSSATTEDLPTASFAGQQETYLNVTRKQLIAVSYTHLTLPTKA